MIKLSQIQKALHAELIGHDVDFTSIATDTRHQESGCLYIALEGERYDGHAFIKEAVDKGAKAVLVSKLQSIPSHVSALLVSDTTEALGKLASYHRSQFSIPMIGITGSCGKTTVKTMVGAILTLMGPTLVTRGNLNNHIGLPLTLLKLNASHRYGVIEMGANAPFEIAYLGSLTKPTITMINNVYPAHLQGFGSVDGVAKAKSEIYEVLDQNGTAVLNLECPYSAGWKTIIKHRKTITYGFKEQAMIRATKVTMSSHGSEFHLMTPTFQGLIRLQVPGEHQILNALASIACVYSLGCPLSIIQEALFAFEAPTGRQVSFKLPNETEIIDDTYNANPGSVEAALKMLSNYSGERLFIMGDMGELGVDTEQWHQKMGTSAKQLGINHFWTVGPLSALAATSFGDGARSFSSQAALIEAFQNLKSRMTVLVKGSRSAGMEGVVNGIKQINKEEA